MDALRVVCAYNELDELKRLREEVMRYRVSKESMARQAAESELHLEHVNRSAIAMYAFYHLCTDSTRPAV